jgi:hypothetical protein
MEWMFRVAPAWATDEKGAMQGGSSLLFEGKVFGTTTRPFFRGFKALLKLG